MNTKKQISKTELAGKTISDDSVKNVNASYSLGKTDSETSAEKTKDSKKYQPVFKEYYY